MPIGRVDTLTGAVTAQHVDGTVETLSQGAPIYQRDLIATKAGAKVALVFVDKTTFALGESGQMRLDEMVFDPSSKAGGKMALSMIKGAFAFVSGDIAGSHEDAMVVRTPVGTIGIRGTAVTGNVDPGGQSTFSAVPDPSGAHSTVAFTNGAGTTIVTENFSITVQNFFTAPGVPFATPGGPGGEMAALMSIAGTIAQAINPGGSSSSDSGDGSGSHPPTPSSPGAQGGDHSPVIHISLAETALPSGVSEVTVSAVVLFDLVPPIPVGVPIPPLLGVPPSPLPSNEPFKFVPTGFVATLGTDHFVGTGAAELFNFAFIPNSLQSGDFVDGGGGNDTLSAAFDKPFSIDATLTIKNVPTIQIALGGSPNVLDALNITRGIDPSATIAITGDGALTVTDLQVNLNASAMTGPLTATALSSAAGIVIEGGAGANSLTGAGFGQGDVLSYQHAAAGVVVNFAAHSATHGGATDTISGFEAVLGSGFGDTINVSLAGGGHSFTVTGGAGNNTLTGAFSDSDFLSYAGAPGAVSVNFAAGTAANGYGGTDSIAGFAGVFGSALGDSFTTTDTTHTIIGGGGNDTVQIAGLNNTLTLIGIDQVNGNSAAVTTNIVLAAPPIGFNIDLPDTGIGTDTIGVVGSGGSIALDNNAATVGVAGADDTVTVGNGADTIGVAGNGMMITAGNGADSIGLIGSSGTIIAGSGADAIAVFGNNDAITVGNGDDSIVVTGNDDTVTFGSGHDTIAVSGSHDFLQDVALPGDSITLSNGNGDTVIRSGNPTDMYTIANSGGDSIQGGTGFNTFSFAGNGQSALTTIQINGAFASDTISAASDDAISFTGSGGHVSLNFAGSGDAITVLGGADTVNASVSVAGDLFAVLGSGDLVSVSDPASQAFLVMVGGGNDTVSVVTGENFVTISLGASAAGANLFGGASAPGGADDVLDLSHAQAGATLDFTTQTAFINSANDTIAGFGAVIGTTGNDIITTDDTVRMIAGGGGADTVNLGGLTNSITVSNIAQVDVLSSNVGAHLTVTALDQTSLFDFTNATSPTLALNIAGSSTIAIGTDMPTIAGAQEISLGTTGPGVSDLILENGSYHLTFDGTELPSGTQTIDGSLMGAGTVLTLDVSAENGNFVINTGASSNDVLTLNNGSDVVSVGGANAVVFAAFGCDTIAMIGGGDVLTVNAGGSIDTFSITGGNDTMIVNTSNTAATLDASGSNDAFSVVGGFDTLTAVGGETFTINLNGGPNVVTAGAGDALTITGGGDIGLSNSISLSVDSANYTITGAGPGNNVTAGNGDDFIAMSGGHEVIAVGGGQDSIDLGSGLGLNTVNIGAGGTDFITVSGTGGDSIVATAGISNLTIVNGPTVAGGDSVTATNGHDLISLGGSGNQITLGDGGDTIGGGGGSETITAIGGGDSLQLGGSGNLVSIVGGPGGDTITSTGSSDTITIASAGSGVVTLGGMNDSLTVGTANVVVNSASDDHITFGGGADTLNIGSFGHDTITLGGSGSLVIASGTGFESIVSGSGNESLGLGTSDDNVSLTGGNETITAGNGTEQITVGSGSNQVSVGSGIDTITITGTGGGTNLITVGPSTTVAFQNVNQSTQGNLNLLQNWSDTGERIDLTALTSASTITNQGAAASPAAAFGSDTPNELDYAVISGNTYVHLAGAGGGYSTHDLLIQIAGVHTLAVSTGVVHH